jgi:hypothetical protein
MKHTRVVGKCVKMFARRPQEKRHVLFLEHRSRRKSECLQKHDEERWTEISWRKMTRVCDYGGETPGLIS